VQRFAFIDVEIFQVEQAILCALGNAQEFVELDVQGNVVMVLCVLDQKHHEKRNDGHGGVDDQLPRIVVMKDSPENDACDSQLKRAGLACLI